MLIPFNQKICWIVFSYGVFYGCECAVGLESIIRFDRSLGRLVYSSITYPGLRHRLYLVLIYLLRLCNLFSFSASHLLLIRRGSGVTKKKKKSWSWNDAETVPVWLKLLKLTFLSPSFDQLHFSHPGLPLLITDIFPVIFWLASLNSLSVLNHYMEAMKQVVGGEAIDEELEALMLHMGTPESSAYIIKRTSSNIPCELVHRRNYPIYTSKRRHQR